MNDSKNNLETEIITNSNVQNSLETPTNQEVQNESSENAQNINSTINYGIENQFSTNDYENNQSSLNFNNSEERNFQKPKINMSKKNLYIITGVILAIIIGVVSIIFIKSTSKNNEQEKNIKELFSDATPILIKKNNKYGYINSKGKEITEIKYDNAKDFVGSYGVVSYEKEINGYTQEIYQLIDKSGKESLNKDTTEKPEYIVDYGVWLIDGVIYNNKLKALTNEDISVVSYEEQGMFYYVNPGKEEAGVVDYTGKIKFKLENTRSLALDFSESDKPLKEELYVSVAAGNKDYIVDLNKGEIIHEISGSDLLQLTYTNNVFHISNINDSEDDTFIYVYDGKVVYKNNEIEFLEVLNPVKNILKIDFGYNYADKGKTKQYMYYYVNDNKYSETVPNEDLSYSNNETNDSYSTTVCNINRNHFQGLKKGDIDILECIYKRISLLDEDIHKYIQNEKKQDLVIVEDDTNTILLDLNTKQEIAKLPGYHYQANEKAPFIVTINNGKTYVYNIITGKQKEFTENYNIEYKTNHIIVKEENKIIYYNQDLKAIYTIEN